MANEPRIAGRFTVDIPDELVTRMQATLAPGTVVDSDFILKVLKQFIGLRELKIYERNEISQAQNRVTARAEALNIELGLKELP